MKITEFENIAYQFEPSPVVADSRAVAFIRLHRNFFRVSFCELFYRVRFSELVSKDGKPTVYVADCRYMSHRSGHVFSNTSPVSLLQDVCDYVGIIK